MSDRPDNELERDAALTAIYKAAAPDAPPPALDAAILAAARRAAGARPRSAGYSFMQKLRVPLSIAAVLVLSVSLVTLMREEAPELAAPPRADAPVSAAKLQSPVSVGESAVAPDRGLTDEAQPSKNLGLKPPQAALPSGLGMQQPGFAERAPRARQDAALDRLPADAVAQAPLAKRREAIADAVDLRDTKEARLAGGQRKEAKPDALPELAQAPATAMARAEPAKSAPEFAANPPASVAAGDSGALTLAENKSRSGPAIASADRIEPVSRERAPMADAPARQNVGQPSVRSSAPASKLERAVDLTPGKWLERIEELRRAGRLDEAKAELAEFRKRYPDYRLPEPLRDWVKP